jgi:hypothetical protein
LPLASLYKFLSFYSSFRQFSFYNVFMHSFLGARRNADRFPCVRPLHQVGSTVGDLDGRLVVQQLMAGEVRGAGGVGRLREAAVLGAMWPYGKSDAAMEVRR